MERRDVFVIGAGASVPYGMPTGFHLLQQLKSLDVDRIEPKLLSCIFNYFSVNNYNTYVIQQTNYDDAIGWAKQYIEHEILSLLRNSCILSIDQFLKNHRDNSGLQFVLKSLMAHEILDAELDAYLNRHNFDETEDNRHIGNIDWIQQLINRIDLHATTDEKLIAYLSKTGFITFNYDRIFEFHLQNFLIHDRRMSFDEVEKVMDKVDVLHINGSLGALYELEMGTSPEQWNELAQRMRTVWEPETTNKKLSEKAKNYIAKANRVYILGSSYIPDNNNAIGLDIPFENKKYIYGTALGLSPANKDRAQSKLKSVFKSEVSMRGRSVCKIEHKSAEDLIIDEFTL